MCQKLKYSILLFNLERSQQLAKACALIHLFIASVHIFSYKHTKSQLVMFYPKIKIAITLLLFLFCFLLK